MTVLQGFSGGSVVNELTCQSRNHRRHGLSSWLGRIPWRRKRHPLQDSRLENPVDRGAWWAAVRGVTELDRAGKQRETAVCWALASLACSPPVSRRPSPLPGHLGGGLPPTAHAPQRPRLTWQLGDNVLPYQGVFSRIKAFCRNASTLSLFLG